MEFVVVLLLFGRHHRRLVVVRPHIKMGLDSTESVLLFLDPEEVYTFPYFPQLIPRERLHLMITTCILSLSIIRQSCFIVAHVYEINFPVIRLILLAVLLRLKRKLLFDVLHIEILLYFIVFYRTSIL